LSAVTFTRRSTAGGFFGIERMGWRLYRLSGYPVSAGTRQVSFRQSSAGNA
jgi:hypothetical protein